LVGFISTKSSKADKPERSEARDLNERMIYECLQARVNHMRELISSKARDLRSSQDLTSSVFRDDFRLRRKSRPFAATMVVALASSQAPLNSTV
jgi:hypothetical protein